MVGLGVQGTRFLDAVHGKSDAVRVVSGVTGNEREAMSTRARFGIPVHATLEEVLADPGVDGVVLATPPTVHSAQVCLSAAAGKHVHCEKPFTLARKDALSAVEACERHGVKLALSYTHRYHPAMQALRQVVESGAIGTVLHAEGNYSHDWGWGAGSDPNNWRASAEANPAKTRFFTANGVHVVDVLISMFGNVGSVYSFGKRRALPYDFLDVFSAHLEFVNGVTASVNALDGTPFIWRVQVYGDKGWAEVRDFDLLATNIDRKVTTTKFPAFSPLRFSLEAFARWIEAGEAFPVTTREAVHGVAAYEGLIESLLTGARVPIVQD